MATLNHAGGLTIIALLIKQFNNKHTRRTILQSTEISAILLGLTLTATFIKSSNDFSQWKLEEDKTERTTKEFEKQLIQQQLESLDREIADEPDNYFALIKRRFLEKNARFKASIEDYELALKIKPDDFNAYLEMGYSLGLLDKKEEREKKS